MYKPLNHQLTAANELIYYKYRILADKQGLGKTFSALYATLNTIDLGYTLIVCPSFLKYNWKEEIIKSLDIDEDKVRVVHTKKQFADFNPIKHHYAIISYSMMKKYPALFKYALTVIVDESHYLCNEEAQRTAIFHHFIEKYSPEYLFLLTGTPINNRVKEFYSLLKLVDLTGYIKDRWPTADNFAEYFSIPVHKSFQKKTRYGAWVTVDTTTYTGYRNLQELRELLSTKMLRREEIKGLNLPPIVFKEVKCFNGSNKKLALEYEQYLEESQKSITSAKVSSAVRKAPIAAEYAENLFNQDVGPIIILSDHKKPIELIKDKLKKYRVAIITGAVTSEKRNKIKNDFQDNQYDFLLATIGAIKEGFTLTASSNMVITDLSWIPSSNEQAIKRINRIGAKETSFIHMMIGDFLDEKLFSSLQEKKETIKQVLS